MNVVAPDYVPPPAPTRTMASHNTSKELPTMGFDPYARDTLPPRPPPRRSSRLGLFQPGISTTSSATNAKYTSVVKLIIALITLLILCIIIILGVLLANITSSKPLPKPETNPTASTGIITTTIYGIPTTYSASVGPYSTSIHHRDLGPTLTRGDAHRAQDRAETEPQYTYSIKMEVEDVDTALVTTKFPTTFSTSYTRTSTGSGLSESTSSSTASPFL